MYDELSRLVQRLMYRRLLVPLAPVWSEFIPWREEWGGFNLVCYPLLLMGTIGAVIALLAELVLPLVFLLLYPLFYLRQTQCCMDSMSRYRGDQRPQQYYEIRLHLMAGYPIAYSSLDSITEQLLAYLHAHGVTQEQVWVRDGVNEADEGGFAAVSASTLTAADVAALQAEEQQQHDGDIEEGGMGQRADLLQSHQSDAPAYRLSDAAPPP